MSRRPPVLPMRVRDALATLAMMIAVGAALGVLGALWTSTP